MTNDIGEEIARPTLQAQIDFLRKRLEKEIDKDSPDIDAVNHLRRDLKRLEMRKNKKG